MKLPRKQEIPSLFNLNPLRLQEHLYEPFVLVHFSRHPPFFSLHSSTSKEQYIVIHFFYSVSLWLLSATISIENNTRRR